MRSTQKNKKPSNFRKEDANRKSSILFTQLGLVLALLLTYIAIEFKTPVNNDFTGIPSNPYDVDNTLIPDTTPEKPKPKKTVKLIPEPDPELIDIKIIKDDDDSKETDVLFSSEDDINKQMKIDYRDFDEVIIKEEVFEISIAIVEEMPVFPGCEGNNEELKICLSKEIGRIVRKNFNPDIAQDIGLKSGEHRIFVMFVIDKDGLISKIESNATDKRLKNEAIRVVKKIPKIKPGTFKGKKVGVKYSLPIRYMVVE